MSARAFRADDYGKQCTICTVYKPHDAFSINTVASSGRHTQCKECISTIRSRQRQIRPCIRCRKPMGMTAKKSARICTRCRGGCIGCGSPCSRPGVCRCVECQYAYERSRKARCKRPYGRTERIMKVYGVKRDIAESVASIKACQACGCVPPRLSLLHVDHDHATGCIRGVLCLSCNAALGHLKDSLDRIDLLHDYLEGWIGGK